MDRQRINARFTVGRAQPGEADIAALAREGFRSIVDLRTGAEADLELPPHDERAAAQQHHMAYAHLPIDADAVDAHQVDRFRDRVTALPGPVYVHCSSGQRSGALTLMHVAIEDALSGEEAIARAQEVDLVTHARLLDLMHDYVDERVSAHSAPPADLPPPG